MFKFKLEPVLALKEKVEENSKRELGVAIQHQEYLYQEKLKLIQEKKQAYEEAQQRAQNIVDVKSLKLFNTYSTYMEQRIEKKGKQLEEADKQVKLKREVLLEAVKERKILNNLKERQEEIFIEEEKQGEQRITDDLVTYKYGKKKKE